MRISQIIDKNGNKADITISHTPGREKNYDIVDMTAYEKQTAVVEKKEVVKKEIKKEDDQSNKLTPSEQYLAKFGKEVPVNKKNDVEWIGRKLLEDNQA